MSLRRSLKYATIVSILKDPEAYPDRLSRSKIPLDLVEIFERLESVSKEEAVCFSIIRGSQDLYEFYSEGSHLCEIYSEGSLLYEFYSEGIPLDRVMDHACKKGYLDVVRFYYPPKDSLTPKDSLRDVTLRDYKACYLMTACYHGHLEIVKYFDPSPRGGGYHTCRLRKSFPLSWLIPGESRQTTQGLTWDTFLFFSAQGGHLNLVKYFEEKGATDFEEAFVRSYKTGSQEVRDYLLSKLDMPWWKKALLHLFQVVF